MAENSIDWKNHEKLKGFLETCVKKNFSREKTLDFVSRDFPQYGKWSMDTFCTRLKQFNIKYIKKETSVVEVKNAVKNGIEWAKSKIWVQINEPKTSNET